MWPNPHSSPVRGLGARHTPTHLWHFALRCPTPILGCWSELLAETARHRHFTDGETELPRETCSWLHICQGRAGVQGLVGLLPFCASRVAGGPERVSGGRMVPARGAPSRPAESLDPWVLGLMCVLGRGPSRAGAPSTVSRALSGALSTLTVTEDFSGLATWLLQGI